MKIAVFLPNWLGDVVMATPTLRALRRHFGQQATMVGIMRPYLTDLLAGTDWLDQLWYFHPKSKDARMHSLAVARRMRSERFDMAVLLPNSLRTALVAWWGGAKERIGYVRYGRGPLLTGKIYPRRVGRQIAAEPMVDSYLAIANLLGCTQKSPRLELATVAADEESADAVFKRLAIRDDGRLITLNCSGAYGASKLWPVENFGRLARRITERLDHDVLVMCGPKERELAGEVVRISGSRRVFSMADQPLDLGTAKACIRRAKLMVSTDSGPRHMAAALDRPVITLFGPMLPIWSDNPTQRAVNLVLELDCIGCHRRTCPRGHHRCMRELTVHRVYGEVTKLLDEEAPDEEAPDEETPSRAA